MLQNSLYSSIFERKSIRKYTGEALSSAQLEAVQEAMDQVQPLLEEKYFLKLSKSRDGHRIYAFCEPKLLSYVNAGFVLQQLDLALHNLGLGRLWFGMGRTPKEIEAPPGLQYLICLKIGVAAESLTRAREEFQREPIEEITDSPAWYRCLEAVRLAPSAVNAQPWFFHATNQGVQVYRRKPHGFMALKPQLNQSDVGIALCHLILELENNNKKWEVIQETAGSIEGCEYVLTVRCDGVEV